MCFNQIWKIRSFDGANIILSCALSYVSLLFNPASKKSRAWRKIIRALCTRSENEFCLHSNVALSILVRCFVGWKKKLYIILTIFHSALSKLCACATGVKDRLVCVERRTVQTQLMHLALCTCITCAQSCLCLISVQIRCPQDLFFTSSTNPPTN